MSSATDIVVQKLNSANKLLGQARDVPSAKHVVDITEGIKTFALREKASQESIDLAYRVNNIAKANLGEELAKMKARDEMAKGARAGGKKTGPRGRFVRPRDKATPLKDLGITKDLSSESQKLARIRQNKPEEFEELGRKKNYKTVQRAERKQKAHEAVKAESKLKGKYRVIYADPPWKYGDAGYGSGPAEFHYPTMSIKELCDLPVKDLALSNSVLFIWVTSPLLEDVFQVINAWGFKYKASFVWDKVKHNVGHYVSVRHEFLLIAVRGSCTPDDSRLIDSVQEIERGKHSAKPEQFREYIEQMYPNGNRIELFARNRSDGWDVWGNQI